MDNPGGIIVIAVAGLENVEAVIAIKAAETDVSMGGMSDDGVFIYIIAAIMEITAAMFMNIPAEFAYAPARI